MNISATNLVIELTQFLFNESRKAIRGHTVCDNSGSRMLIIKHHKLSLTTLSMYTFYESHVNFWCDRQSR